MEDGQETFEAVSLSFPLARVRKIMKADGDVGMIQNDALLATCAAAEVFVEFLAEQAAQISEREKRKTVVYKDIGKPGQRYLIGDSDNGGE